MNCLVDHTMTSESDDGNRAGSTTGRGLQESCLVVVEPVTGFNLNWDKVYEPMAYIMPRQF